LNIETVLTAINSGSKFLGDASGSSTSNVLQFNKAVLIAMRKIPTHEIDMLMLTQLGDFGAAKRLHKPLSKIVSSKAKKMGWKEFKPGDDINCWSALASVAITEYMHGCSTKKNRNGMVAMDASTEPVVQKFKYKERELSRALKMNNQTFRNRGIYSMHQEITGYMDIRSAEAAATIIRRLK